MRRLPTIAVVVAASVAACSYSPVVDKGKPGFDEAKFRKDVGECTALYEGSPAGQAAKQGAVGAVAGAVIGVLLGAIGGSPGRSAATGAVIGAAGGAASGAGKGYSEEEKIIRNCMTGRGWVLLN